MGRGVLRDIVWAIRLQPWYPPDAAVPPAERLACHPEADRNPSDNTIPGAKRIAGAPRFTYIAPGRRSVLSKMLPKRPVDAGWPSPNWRLGLRGALGPFAWASNSPRWRAASSASIASSGRAPTEGRRDTACFAANPTPSPPECRGTIPPSYPPQRYLDIPCDNLAAPSSLVTANSALLRSL